MADQKFYTELSFFKLWFGATVLSLIGAAVVQSLGLWANALLFTGVILVLGTSLLIFRLAQLIFDRNRRHDFDYQQIEALFSIYHHLQPKVSLPPTRKHAGSPDFLKLIMELLKQHEPKVIVEASSGISSIVVSEYLRQHLPDSQHFALEHEEKYAALTQAKTSFDGTKIIHAPLQQYILNGESHQWYSVEHLKHLAQIDLLIVDGPPRFIQTDARYPAVPVLLQELNLRPKVILMDDTIREPERRAAERWAREHQYELQSYPLEKGGIVLLRKD